MIISKINRYYLSQYERDLMKEGFFFFYESGFYEKTITSITEESRRCLCKMTGCPEVCERNYPNKFYKREKEVETKFYMEGMSVQRKKLLKKLKKLGKDKVYGPKK